jgi:hypothetical protein
VPILPKFIRALPWRGIQKWTTGCAVVAAIGALGGYVAFGGAFTVQKVEVQNRTPLGVEGRSGQFRSHVSAAEVRHLADIRNGEPLLGVDLARAVSGVLHHPWVARAEAKLQWPDTVVISVEEHVPVLLLEQQGLYYVDAKGEIFKRARNDDLDYPVLTGIDEDLARWQGELARKVLTDAISILADVKTSGEMSVTDVSEIHFDRWNGFDVVLRSGTDLAFGFADPADRLSRLHKMRAAGLDPTVPQRIDLASDRLAVATPYLVEIPPAPVVAPQPAAPAAPLDD